MSYFKKIPAALFIILLGAIIFLPFIGETHLFDLDEIEFAEAAREMLVSDNFKEVQINFTSFNKIPPLFFWMQATAMHFFGVNEFAARLPNALIGILTLLVVFHIGKRLKDKKFGILWALVYLSSFLPHIYFKTGLIEPSFNLFVFLSIYFVTILTENDEFFYRSNKRKRRIKLLAFAAFFAGLSVLTKGPIGIILHSFTFLVYLAFTKFKKTNTFGEIVWFGIVFLMTIFTWHGIGFYENGPIYITEFIQRNVDLLQAECFNGGGPVYYHFIVLLLGCFPASIFMFGGIKKHKFSTDLLQNFQKWMIALLIVVLVVFSFVQTKVVHYSSLAYFPITFFATYYLYYHLKKKKKWKWYHNTLLLFVGVLLGIAITLIPLIGYNPEILIGFLKNEFIIGVLQTKVYWSNWESLYGLAFIGSLVLSANLFYTKNKRLGIAVLLISSTIIIEVVAVIFAPRIEMYTQSATIEFYESKKEEDCYIEVLGFKSYGHLFYTDKKVENCIYTPDELLSVKLTKPAYFVSKNIDKDTLLIQYEKLELLYEKNGFVFYKKKE